jgi:hypothetical protein
MTTNIAQDRTQHSAQQEPETEHDSASLDTGLSPKGDAPESQTENKEYNRGLSMALMARAFGSAKMEMGAGGEDGQIADNRESINAGWNVLRRAKLGLQAMGSMFHLNKDNNVNRDAGTLDMMDGKTFKEMEQLGKAHRENDSELLTELRTSITDRLNEVLARNTTLSENEKANIRDIAALAMDGDKDRQSRTYKELNDSQFEKTRTDSEKRWWHGALNAGITAGSKLVTVATAPFTAGVGGIALGSSVELLGLRTSTFAMEKAAVDIKKGQLKAALNRELEAFVSIDPRNDPHHDRSYGETQLAHEHQANKVYSKEQANQNNTVPLVRHFQESMDLAERDNASVDEKLDALRAGRMLLANANRIESLKTSGEGTLSAANYGTYEKVMQAREDAYERIKKLDIMGPHEADLGKEGLVVRIDKKLAGLSSDNNDADPTNANNEVCKAMFVDAIRASEEAKLEGFSEDALKNIRAEMRKPQKIVLGAVGAVAGNTAALLTVGVDAIGRSEAFQGTHAVGVEKLGSPENPEYYMKLSEYVKENASQAFQERTGLSEGISDAVASGYTELTNYFSIHHGTLDQFNDRFAATAKDNLGRPIYDAQGNAQLLSQAQLDAKGTEAVKRFFSVDSIPAGESDSFIKEVAGLKERGFEFARGYDFDAHARVHQGAIGIAKNIVGAATTLATVGQAVWATGGLKVEAESEFKFQRRVTPIFDTSAELNNGSRNQDTSIEKQQDDKLAHINQIAHENELDSAVAKQMALLSPVKVAQVQGELADLKLGSDEDSETFKERQNSLVEQKVAKHLRESDGPQGETNPIIVDEPLKESIQQEANEASQRALQRKQALGQERIAIVSNDMRAKESAGVTFDSEVQPKLIIELDHDNPFQKGDISVREVQGVGGDSQQQFYVGRVDEFGNFHSVVANAEIYDGKRKIGADDLDKKHVIAAMLAEPEKADLVAEGKTHEFDVHIDKQVFRVRVGEAVGQEEAQQSSETGQHTQQAEDTSGAAVAATPATEVGAQGRGESAGSPEVKRAETLQSLEDTYGIKNETARALSDGELDQLKEELDVHKKDGLAFKIQMHTFVPSKVKEHLQKHYDQPDNMSTWHQLDYLEREHDVDVSYQDINLAALINALDEMKDRDPVQYAANREQGFGSTIRECVKKDSSVSREQLQAKLDRINYVHGLDESRIAHFSNDELERLEYELDELKVDDPLGYPVGRLIGFPKIVDSINVDRASDFEVQREGSQEDGDADKFTASRVPTSKQVEELEKLSPWERMSRDEQQKKLLSELGNLKQEYPRMAELRACDFGEVDSDGFRVVAAQINEDQNNLYLVGKIDGNGELSGAELIEFVRPESTNPDGPDSKSDPYVLTPRFMVNYLKDAEQGIGNRADWIVTGMKSTGSFDFTVSSASEQQTLRATLVQRQNQGVGG